MITREVKLRKPTKPPVLALGQSRGPGDQFLPLGWALVRSLLERNGTHNPCDRLHNLLRAHFKTASRGAWADQNTPEMRE